MDLPHLIPSPFRIVGPGFVLLDTADNGKDYLVDNGGPLIRLDGARVVEQVPFAGEAGMRNFDRGNRSHTLGFTAARLFATAQEAFADQLNRMMDLPGGRGAGIDYTLTIPGYGQQMTLRSAVITAAKAGVQFDTSVSIPLFFLSVFDFTLQGGALEGSALLPSGGSDGTFQNEDGSTALNEDGSTNIPQ